MDKSGKKAKAFWFFSYGSNGMNFKDIANLKHSDLGDGIFSFHRAKTIKTDKTQSEVIVYLKEIHLETIRKYGNPNEGGSYLFPIIDGKSSPENQRKQLQNFTRFVNQHFLKYANSLGIDKPISTYWARHSFATQAIRKGASMEMVSQALSHSSLNTTKAYFAGFENEKKKEMADLIFQF